MKYPETIIIALGLVAALGSRAVINWQQDAPPTPAPAETVCPPGEWYHPDLDRCWPVATEEPTETPPWGADIQATMDADPFDNDYQYVDWCFDYVNGGTRIVYYPCNATPEPP